MSGFAPQASSADLGVYGLGVMGSNLARNLARNGYSVAVFNRTLARTERLMERHGQEGDFVPAQELKDFVAALRVPRVAIIMVQAGAGTEAAISQLADLMEPGDIIVDAGNTLYTDTRRREEALRERGIHFVGMGVSGGEEGALLGPSIMPGGTAESYRRLGPMLESISAKVDGVPCCTHVGPDGAGHFVKMVHNGIEYADMQLIAEAYDLLRRVGGLSVPQIAEVFRDWKDSELDSYLIDVTTEVLERTDPATGRPFVDVVVDAASQKGTGVWTTQTALDLGVAVPAIAEATFARAASSSDRLRSAVRTAEIDPGTADQPPMSDQERRDFIDSVKQALYGSKIAAYAQGFDEIATASQRYGWDIDLGAMATIWRAGCIIRARFLEDITRAYAQDPALPSLLAAPGLSQALASALPAWRRVVATSALAGVPAPAFASSLAYLDQLRAERLPAALIQGQRDFFGSHTYHRVDDPEGVYHVLWATEDRPEEKWD
ncbi:NADP-dependent phosphogluconate dehydrogenase [Actinomyces bowdenii]|uniref:6-phosphogluconate dehydrogenase, decarboxylating n=1 Tax=Actinomyces bowdenii TaxID=131109 RepID=A0A853EMJ6_9ACTO|nr:NADP-dependent phosphogluconate dehydrogenase [Actinomyces bowdenii]MBF0698286.1 NADP-dependent phosphogluconate dehydrogenase [Actinomyces bowdenii]NYS70458.1 NADP-dependent phosphogluconate dehydrogenase [Actinomyces bowdenii]